MKLWLYIGVVVILLDSAYAACPFGETDSIFQYGVTWYFEGCHQYGQFANSDYWVLGPVKITQIAPDSDGQHNGWMVNPSVPMEHAFDAGVSSMTFKAGLVPVLPYTAQPGESIVKAITGTNPARTPLRVIAVLTVLGTVPPDNGATIFRPPFFGNDKAIYSVNDLHLEYLPKVQPPAGKIPAYTRIRDRFIKPQYDVGGYPGEGVRAYENFMGNCFDDTTSARSYGGSMALDNGDAALAFMLDYPDSEKLPALIPFVQYGIDLYHIMLNGANWRANGGHANGRKLTIILAGTLLEDEAMKNAVKNAPYNTFSEDGHIYSSSIANGGNGEVLFGDVNTEGGYWLNEITDSGSRTARDPYEYIDTRIPGTSYQSGINSMIWKGPAVAMQLMPQINAIWNNLDFMVYVDRWVTFGAWAQPDPCAPVKGVCYFGTKQGQACTYAASSNEKFDSGFKDTNGNTIYFAVNSQCPGGFCGGGICEKGPYAGLPCGYDYIRYPVGPAVSEGGNGCGYELVGGEKVYFKCIINTQTYKVSYGPDPNNPGMCILDQDSSDGIGRHPYRHGDDADTGGYNSAFVNAMWDAYRNIGCAQNSECTDSDFCTYDLCKDSVCVNNNANLDGGVNIGLGDIIQVIAHWATAGPTGDVDSNGNVGLSDVLAVISLWSNTC